MIEYLRFNLPDKRTLQQMNALEIFGLILEHDRVTEYNTKLYSSVLDTYKDIFVQASDIFGPTHYVVDILAKYLPKEPPKTIRFSTLMRKVKEAWADRLPKESERKRILAELAAAGLSDNTNRSTAELRDRLERHYVNQLRDSIMNGKKFHQLYDRSACNPRCLGWDGKSDFCNCRRTKLRWIFGPRHTTHTPQILAARIGFNNTTRKETLEEEAV